MGGGRGLGSPEGGHRGLREDLHDDGLKLGVLVQPHCGKSHRFRVIPFLSRKTAKRYELSLSEGRHGRRLRASNEGALPRRWYYACAKDRQRSAC